MKNAYLMVTASLLALVFVLCASALRAQQISNCPPSPYPVTVKQADGTRLTIVGKGSMLNPWSETVDGYSVVQKNGIYQYATLAGGKLVPSGVPAKNVRERKSTEADFLKQVPKSLRQSPGALPGLAALRAAASTAAPRQAGYASKGNLKTLMLLIRYPDLPQTNTADEFHALMNKPNYRGTGSFKDFFATSSLGQLNVTTDVQGWYTAAHNYDYYGWENGAGRSTELVREAVNAAELAGVDFSQYDNDGNGVVDGIIVVHAGPGAEEGSQMQYIWSHRFGMGTYGNEVTYDGVLIDDYIINPERRLFTGEMTGIGVFCHEFGHNLNLPDLYDTDGSNGHSEGLGEWSLMASASWLGNEHTPGNMCAWCRKELNWLTPTVISADGSYTLPAASGSDQVFRINTPLSNEYYLLENRQNTGLDASLKGSGLAVFHVNSEISGNGDANMKMVDLEEADGRNDLDQGINRSDGGDLFPGSSNNAAFNDATNPNSRTYTNATTHISISNIAIDETGNALFQVSLIPRSVTITGFAPASGPVGAGVAIKGTQLVNVTAVRFNGVAATEFYEAGPSLLYATVPPGATTGPIEVVTRQGGTLSSSAFEVTPIASVWKARALLIKPRAQHGVVTANGRIYAFGGINKSGLLRSLEIYDPQTNAWRSGSAMPTPRRGMAFAVGSNGLIYAISGLATSEGVVTSAATAAYSYNPKTNKWKTLASIPDASWEGSAATAATGKVYVFGGETEGRIVSRATRIYDVATNSWASGADIPVAVMQHSALTGADGRIYLVGGRNSADGGPAGLVQIYDPATNSWSAGAEMLLPKVQFGLASGPGNLIYVVGGKAAYDNSRGPFFHTVEIYDPASDGWSSGPVLPAPVGELKAGILDGNLYAVGGTDGTYRQYNYRLVLAPAAPASLTAKAAGTTRIDLKWQDLARNEAGYTVERAPDPAGPFIPIASLGAGKTSYSNSGLEPNTTYYYRVLATNSAGPSPYSNVASATTNKAKTAPDNITGDDTPAVVARLRVGPNPMQDRTQVEFQVSKDQEVVVEIYDEAGTRLLPIFQGWAQSGKVYQIGWQPGSLPAGIYICRLVTAKKTFYHRIVLRP